MLRNIQSLHYLLESSDHICSPERPGKHVFSRFIDHMTVTTTTFEVHILPHSCFSVCGVLTSYDEMALKIEVVVTYICRTFLTAMFDLSFTPPNN